MAFPPGLRMGYRSYRPQPITAVAPDPLEGPEGAVEQLPGLAAPGPLALPQTLNTLPITGGPTTSLPMRVGAQAVQGASAVGKAIVNNPGTALSVIQGIGGALSYATAKDPGRMPAPAAYTPPIRGAQGIESSSYNQARQDILGTQTVASTADTSDVASNTVQRLLAQTQTNKALTGLAGQNNQAYQSDRARVVDQESQAYQTNYQQGEQFKQNRYGEDRRQYEARRVQGAAQVQGAIDNLFGSYNAKQQAGQVKLEGQNRRTEAEITQLHTDLASATSPEQRQVLLNRLKQLDPESTRFKAASMRYGTPAPSLGAGGSLPTGELKFTPTKTPGASGSKAKGTKSTKPRLPASVVAEHQLSADFARHLDRASAQSRAAFDRSIQLASRLRTTGGTAAAFGRRR